MLKSGGWRKIGSLRGPAKQRATDGAILLKAAKMQKLRLVRMMLDGGVDVNWQNEEGYNALMCVITSHTSDSEDPQASSKYTMVDYLLRVGTDPNVRDRNGKTALIHACQLNTSADIVQLLILCNADPSIRDFSASSAIDYAHAQQNEGVIKVLTHANNMKKVVNFSNSQTFAKDESLMHTYLQVPKPDEPARTRRGHNPLGSPKPLKRQNTICCTGDDEFRRLWEEEIGGNTSPSKNEPITKSSAFSTVLRRRNTSAAIPSISFSMDTEEEHKYDLDSPYYDMKRVNDSLFEWEQKSVVVTSKSKARRAWLDTCQKALKSRRSQLASIQDENGEDGSCLGKEDGDDKMLKCAMASRLRSSSLTHQEDQHLQPPPGIVRSKSEERTKDTRILRRLGHATALNDTIAKYVTATHPPFAKLLQKPIPDIRDSDESISSGSSSVVDLHSIKPVIDGSGDEEERTTKSDDVKSELILLAPARKQPPMDVRPKHPHAKFFNARSNTFHGSRFKNEELVETI